MPTQEYDVDTINKMHAANAAMVEALEDVVEGRPHNPPPSIVPQHGVAWKNWRMFEKCRAALNLAKGAG